MVSNEYYFKSINESVFLGQKSKDTYIANIKTILVKTSSPTLHDLLSNPGTHGPILMDLPSSINTKFTYFVTILAFLKYSGLKAKQPKLFTAWYDFFLQIKQQVRHKEMENIPSEKQKSAMLDWQTIIATRDAQPRNSWPHLLLSIYTYLPPRRQLDYANLRVYTDTTMDIPPSQRQHNYIHMYSPKYKSPYMNIAVFKTAKFFKKPFFNKNIPPELINIIAESLKSNPRDHLFTMRDNKPWNSATTFQQWSNRILKDVFKNPHVTVGTLRHAYDTMLSTTPGITAGRRQIDAMKMGHSVKKALEYSLHQRDPPLALYTAPAKKDECFKKSVRTGKIIPIACP